MDNSSSISKPKNWFCANCGKLVSIIGNDFVPITHEPSIRLLIEKKPHRICIGCIELQINAEKKIRDMRTFLRVSFPNKIQKDKQDE